jgi:hypothetical protein
VELNGKYVERIDIFNSIACCFLYYAKDLSASFVVEALLGPIAPLLSPYNLSEKDIGILEVGLDIPMNIFIVHP